MTILLTYRRETSKTARRLAHTLAEHVRLSASTSPHDADLIINWGAPRVGSGLCLNHPDKTINARNKLAATHTFAEAGLPVKHPYSKDDDVPVPAMARKRFHQSARGLWVCETQDALTNAWRAGADYAQELINIKMEYRIHVFQGEIIRYCRKLPSVDNPGRIRAIRYGWRFRGLRQERWRRSICRISKAALEALDLDFGAVDIATDTDGNNWLFEVNTAPGIDRSSLAVWVNALTNWINTTNGVTT